MIKRFSVNTGDRRGPIDVEANAPAEASLRDVLDALRVADHSWFCDSRQVGLDTRFTQIRNGSVLERELSANPAEAPAEVRVISGPSTGMRTPIVGTGVSIGRGEECDLAIGDASVSRQHASLRVEGLSVVLVDNDSTNGTRVNGKRIQPGIPHQIESGDIIEVGDSVLRLAHRPPANGEVIITSDGRSQFNIQPRSRSTFSALSLELPVRPQQSDDFSSNIALGSSVTTAVGTITAAVMMGRLQFLFIALLAPLQYLVVNRIQQRRRNASFRKELAKYDQLSERRLSELSVADIAEVQALRESYPSIDEIRDICDGPTSRLWERQPEDDDYASFRVGSSDCVASSRIKIGDSDPLGSKLPKIPIVGSFRQHPIVGLVGHRPSTLGVARWIVLQMSALHSPGRMRIILLCPEDGETDWGWIKWLPHVWDGDLAHIATDELTSKSILEALVATIDDALQDIAVNGSNLPPPHTLLLIDGLTRLAGNASLERIFTEGSLVGITVLSIESSRERLRYETSGLITVSDHATVEVSWLPPSKDRQVVEMVDSSLAEQVARSISHLEPMAGARTTSSLPFPLFFDEVLPKERFDREGLVQRWRGRSPSTSFAFGVSESGPLSLDLVADGPHFLVVGTSGAGKSEAIQSMIASLACSNRPDQLNFALIDFKGGACYGAAMDLPHSTAKIVNLQGTDGVNRALASIDAELTWRQERFAEVEPRASSLEEYNTRRLPSQQEIPRLVIVIDEYAVFVNEAKGATERVTKIARIGRSLGMHLIIGTQSPRGVVDNAIKANVQTKICLRTGDSTESTLVLDSPLPSRIPGQFRGRGYALTPNGKLTLFQTAWVGAPLQTESPEIQVRYFEFSRLAHSANSPTNAALAEVTPRKRFDILADDIESVWKNIPESSRTFRSPILPALEPHIPLSSIVSATEGICIAIQDRLARQDQPIVHIDVLDRQHILILGSPGSGRTSALRTIAVAAGYCTYPTHVYCIDLGSRRLAPLEDLSHVGVVITESDIQKASDLLTQINDEIRRRDELLGRQRVNSIDELDDVLPAMLLLIDNWRAFSRLSESDRSVATVFNEILAKGGSTGLKVIVAGDHEFDLSLSRSFAEKFLLYFNDQTPYLRYGVELDRIPSHMVSGRAMQMSSGDIIQFAEVSQIETSILPSHPSWSKPMTLAGLPDRVPLSALPAREESEKPFVVSIGVAGSRNEPLVVDLQEAGAILVSGPPKAGRSSLLEAIAIQLRSNGVRLAFIGGKRSRLRGREDLWDWTFDSASPAIAPLLDQIADEKSPVALLLDDVRAEVVDDPIFSKFADDLKSRTIVVNSLWSEARMINMRSPIGRLLKDSCMAAVLMPEPDSQIRDLLVVIPRSIQQPGLPGRGLFFRDGTAATFQALVP